MDHSDRAVQLLGVLTEPDVDAAVDRLHGMCPTTNDIWASCCAMASMVLHVADAGTPDVDSPLGAHVVALDDHVDPARVEAMEQVGAFIAAIGNDDYEGARLLFEHAGETAQSAGLFIAHMLGIAAAAVRHSLEDDGQDGGE